jgi:hypothetical protein
MTLKNSNDNQPSINISVNLSQFPTDVLITELWNRVYDHLHDEEPQVDATFDTLPYYEKDSLRQSLEECK